MSEKKISYDAQILYIIETTAWGAIQKIYRRTKWMWYSGTPHVPSIDELINTSIDMLREAVAGGPGCRVGTGGIEARNEDGVLFLSIGHFSDAAELFVEDENAEEETA